MAAALDATLPTLLDLAKRLYPGGGGLLPIVEMLSQRNSLLGFLHMKEANMLTGELTSERTSLPSVATEASAGAASTRASPRESRAPLRRWR